MRWNSTTLIVAEVKAGGVAGLGYTYTDASAAGLIGRMLGEAIEGGDAMDVPALWEAMQRRVRNIGRQGLAATAISAVDAALWDAKAKLLGLPLAVLLGRSRVAVPIYGSGGFTTYDDGTLREQLSGWVERDGCAWVKMKIGTHPEQDPNRVAVARGAIGDRGLFVDSNGAFDPKRALAMTERLAAESNIVWHEEPVSSDDLEGMRLVRQCAPATVEVAAGEYGYEQDYFSRMLASGAVDVQQADASRCAASQGSCRRRRCARRTTPTFPATARRPCTSTPPVPRRACAT